ncbi:zinc-binding dehydrogenase [Streptomyces sp. NPDC003857]
MLGTEPDGPGRARCARIGRTLPLAQAAQAHRLGETGRINGKLVLIP